MHPLSSRFRSVWLIVAIFGASLVGGQQNGEVIVSDRLNNSSNHRRLGDFVTSPTNDQLTKVQYIDANGLPVLVQFTYVGPPKILPIASADSYPEGSSINLICTVSGGQRHGLTLSWTINNSEIDEHNGNYPEFTKNVSVNKDGSDISILRIRNATGANTGTYSCTAKNPLGQDSTSVKIVINVEMKWQKVPKDAEIGLNQELSIECSASGTPQPTIQWLRHGQRSGLGTNGTILSTNNGVLKIVRTQHKDSGLYECVAKNGVDDDMRKVIQVRVRVVPARFSEKFSVVQVKGGDSAKLECNATGDQPLTINWFKEDSKLSKRGGDNFEIYESMVSTGLNSVLVIRSVGRADGITYKCVGENEYGNDERLIKLMVMEAPSRPMNPKLKEAWSREASIVWSAPYAGNSPISSYVVQYWRKSSSSSSQNKDLSQTGAGEESQSSGIQNHRRQEFSVAGNQNSALIKNLMPATSYEAFVVAENQVGRSEASENVVINTGEDEPAAAPSDVSVEARGPSTIRVAWKVPPSETWNGRLIGFYVGFRPRGASNTIDQLSASSAGPFSYRTIDYVRGQLVFETFLTNLARGHDYEVVVKAFNSIGSGPESHSMTVRTFDGDLPAPPSLLAQHASHSSIGLRWTYQGRGSSSASTSSHNSNNNNPIKRYIIYFQRKGDDSWLEMGVPVEERSARGAGQPEAGSVVVNEFGGSASFVLTGLEPGSTYKIYVVAVNNFGMGDPSNIVTTRTEQLNGGELLGAHSRSSLGASGSGELGLFEMSKQYQWLVVMPIASTIIMVLVVVSAVLYCSRRMQVAQPAQHVLTNQAGTLPPVQAGGWGGSAEGTVTIGPGGQRYVELDKNGILKNNGSLIGSDQGSSGHGGHYPLPYGTMPMNSVIITDQKSWDRQSSAPLKPSVAHIYDSPI